MKAIYLFADSTLLFVKRADGSALLDEVVQSSGKELPSVAYIGASNGDNPVFYHDIFLPAFGRPQVGERRMIRTHPAGEDKSFLEGADIIVLAGGSLEVGWRTFVENGFKTIIARRYFEGAVLIGISAGATQIGRGGFTDDESAILPTFGFLPCYVMTGEERVNWKSLRRMVCWNDRPSQGIGIPAGGGVLCLDGSAIPIRKPLFEIFADGPECREDILFPPQYERYGGF